MHTKHLASPVLAPSMDTVTKSQVTPAEVEPQQVTLARVLGNSYVQTLARDCCQRLDVSHPDDGFEQHADEVSARLLTRINRTGQSASHSDHRLEMDALNYPEEGGVVDRVEPLPALPRTGNRLESQLASRYGAGQPLPKDLRRSVEPLLGYDLEPVRIHPHEGSEMADAVDARAFTVGRHIYFDRGEYRPGTQDGMRILLHELVHTSQPGGETIQRTKKPRISSWDFHNTGSKATDNCASALAGGFKLGPDNKFYGASSFTNGAEMQANIDNHKSGATYDIKRVKERSTWDKVAGAWTNQSHVGPGADDDPDNIDECLTPSASPEHIYSADAPGFPGTSAFGASATEAVYKATFTESVDITDGSTVTHDATTLDWHSITWVTKTGGTWTFDAARSEIATGAVTVGTTAP